MPGPIMMKPQLPATVDPAKASPNDSLLKTLLRKAAAGAQTLGLDDPSGMMGVGGPLTTIGPKAIPLQDTGTYLKEAVGSSLDDLLAAGKRFHSASMPARTTMGNATRDMDIVQALAERLTGNNNPGAKIRSVNDMDPSEVKRLVQKLADAYLPDYLK